MSMLMGEGFNHIENAAVKDSVKSDRQSEKEEDDVEDGFKNNEI